MPKVSVLMNCYNGEAYLKEAIDSVFAQSVTDWEIVFIDNCSTDRSAEIAQSYGEKIKYHKTEKNIPLGAARNFGLPLCSGEYVAFLDTDDIWLPQMLEKQLEAISEGDFALVYAGQIEINAKGEQIGIAMPAEKSGNIFAQLLTQFDIPIVTTMINRAMLTESGLNFDLNVSASEEYCLFMQFAVNHRFKVIPEALIKYRIHDKSLTNSTIEKWALERRYTLNKIIAEHPVIERTYKREFREAFARAAYYEAQYAMAVGKHFSAFKALVPFMFTGLRYFILTLVLLFPSVLWKKIQQKKYKRNI